MPIRIIKVVPTEVTVTVEIPLSEIKKLILALENTTVTFDGARDPQVAEASKYLIHDFFPTLVNFVEELEGK